MAKTISNPFTRKPNETLSIYVLKLVGLGVVFTAVTILSPTFLYAVLRSYIHYKLNSPTKRQIRDSLRYLRRKRFIAYENRGGKMQMVLTKLGKKRLSKLHLSDIIIKPEPWDGQWRLLTFDIPEDHKAARHVFRKKLKELGFYHFQRSVFILPYPCEKEIEQLAEILDVQSYVHVLTTQRFQNDRALVKKFSIETAK